MCIRDSGTGRGSENAKYFVFESDEYERHFMPYHPEYSIITNIDFDHPDYFTSLEDVFNAFNDYAKQITKGLFVYGEDAELRKITANAPIYYYGFEADNNDFVASDLLRSTTGSTFTVHFRGQELGQDVYKRQILGRGLECIQGWFDLYLQTA